MISGDRSIGRDQLDNGGPGQDVDGMEYGVDNVLVSARRVLIFTGIQEGNPGRGTAGRADPIWPNRAGCFILCALMLGSGEGEQGGGNTLAAWEEGHRSRPGEQLSGLCGLCCVFSLSLSLLLLFPLFAVLYNCPYPDPPVSACFFPFSSAPQRGKGWSRGAFLGSCSPNITVPNNFLEIDIFKPQTVGMGHDRYLSHELQMQHVTIQYHVSSLLP